MEQQGKSETDRIIQRYHRREKHKVSYSYDKNQIFEYYRNYEREAEFSKLITLKYGNDLSSLKVLEIGAGYGVNLDFFTKIGILPRNIWANELLSNRVEKLKNIYPSINILPGDALEIKFENKFDIVLQSMLFSSVLDDNYRKLLAIKIMKFIKLNGMILWYDLSYDNPWNKDVKCIKKTEIRKLFPNMKQQFKRTTLLPPLARVVGHYYNTLNTLCPILRTHLVACITIRS